MAILDGKAVIITGAGRGLGRAYALNAASHGASLIINDVDPDACHAVAEEINESGGRATAYPGSVTDWSLGSELIAACTHSYGTLDGLVANAGLYYSTPPWDDSEDRIRKIVEVNLVGAIFCNVHALQHMKEQGHGSIVNVSSGSQAGMTNIATYGATKGALASYTYSAALDARPYNVRVNAISPLASTRMGAVSRGDVSDSSPDTTELAGKISERTSQIGRPESIAPLVTFLLSDLAADITGQVLRLSQGRLSLFTHPSVAPSDEFEEEWTPESIATAWEKSLVTQLCPVAFGEDTYIGPSGAGTDR